MNQGLTNSGITTSNALHVLISILMIGTGMYLTDHYYTTIYPATLGGGSSLCDISSFWNCDVATYSPLAAIAGVPISVFGVITGLLFLGASIFPSEAYERTASAVSKINFIGCVVLFAYSLIALGTLCPMCSFYYVMSGCAAVLFWKKGINTWRPDVKVTAIWGVIVLVTAVGFNRYTAVKHEKQNTLSSQIVDQFNKLAQYGDPEVESPYKIHMSTANFSEAPIRVTVFSDFQCPFCKHVADQIPQLLRRYGAHMNVQYMFYPLDSSCNTSMKSQIHPFACRAAMLAACDTKKFVAVHDDIFLAQEGMTLETLEGLAKKYDLEKCFQDQSTRALVEASMNQAPKFSLKSTPTLIINGRKIEGSIPNPHFHAIFDDLLKKK